MTAKDEAPAAIEGSKLSVKGLKITFSRPFPVKQLPDPVYPLSVERRGESEILEESSPKRTKFRPYALLDKGDAITGKHLWGLCSEPLSPSDIVVGKKGRTGSHSGQDLVIEGVCLMEIIHGWRGDPIFLHPKNSIGHSFVDQKATGS